MGEVHARIDRCVVDLVDEEKEVMPTKWILISEYLDEDGNVWIVSAASVHSTVWDRMGLLDFALNREKVAVKG